MRLVKRLRPLCRPDQFHRSGSAKPTHESDFLAEAGLMDAALGSTEGRKISVHRLHVAKIPDSFENVLVYRFHTQFNV